MRNDEASDLIFADIAVVLALALYKITSLLVGLALCYLGYRLFVAGVWGKAGDLDAKFGNNKLILKSAAPGTFFALFGTIVIAVTIWKGFELQTGQTRLPEVAIPAGPSERPLPDKPPF